MASSAETSAVSSESATSSPESEMDEDMKELESIGDVEVDNGILFVRVTLPKDLVGEDVTQEELDEKSGDYYTSAKLNEDGSVTYRMTKSQHRKMLEGIKQGIDEGINEFVNGDDYSISGITYNDDVTEFDIMLDGTEVGLAESFAALPLFMYSGMYQIFSGKKADSIVINYYDPSGNVIDTYDSSEMEDSKH